MQGTASQARAVRGSVTFLLVATLIVSFLQHSICDMSTPTLDALRYADYALNIHDHRVFGLSGSRRNVVPEPGNANSPLYPALVAAVMAFDERLANGLRCTLGNPATASACEQHFRALEITQCALVIGALWCVWLSAMWLFGRQLVAGMACALALASTKPMFYANLILTEVLVLFLFAALMAALVAACRRGRIRAWAAVAILLGALALTRPEYLYLGYVMGILGVAVTLMRPSVADFTRLAAAIGVFVVVLAPWLVRNEHHFGSPSLTGGYGDVILAYRAGYNRMGPREWAGAFIAWLPGHGDALAEVLLPPEMITKLGTGPDSYLYGDGQKIFDEGLAAVDGERHRLTAYLIRTEILAHPLRHFATSVPLAWRGILSGKYLAVAGVPCLLFLVAYALARRERVLLVLLLPPAVMVALYAAVSVSVPRYNVYLIYYYGLAISWALVSLIERAPLAPAPAR